MDSNNDNIKGSLGFVSTMAKKMLLFNFGLTFSLAYPLGQKAELSLDDNWVRFICMGSVMSTFFSCIVTAFASHFKEGESIDHVRFEVLIWVLFPEFLAFVIQFCFALCVFARISHWVVWSLGITGFFLDYCMGMIFADMFNPDTKKQPCLWFVELPVVGVPEAPDYWNYGPPKSTSSRNVCVTDSGIKFVYVEDQHSCRTALHRERSKFCISSWSWCIDSYTWRKDATLDAEELWALDTEDRFPHILPEFPVVSIEDPDVICFMLNETRDYCDSGPRKWMIELDMKKELRAVTAYSYEQSFAGDAVGSARMVHRSLPFVSSKMPCYLYGKQSCKKKRKLQPNLVAERDRDLRHH